MQKEPTSPENGHALTMRAQTLRDRVFQHVQQSPGVMGILNITPDSFYDGGDFIHPKTAISQAKFMMESGAIIIDVGAESTRPGATAISADEEVSRLRPILGAICQNLDIAVSVDTYKAQTAEWAIGQGASIINDVWGLQYDRHMAPIVAQSGAGIIIMHNKENEDSRSDILADVHRFFETSFAIADRAGIPTSRIMLDPGLGFKKTRAQDYVLLNNLSTLKNMWKVPIVLGLSRKRMIGDILKLPKSERLPGTLVANTLGLVGGADLLRVHDVAPHTQAVKIFEQARCAS